MVTGGRAVRVVATLALVATGVGAEPVEGPDLDGLLKLVRERTVFGDLSAAELRQAAAEGIVAALNRRLGRVQGREPASCGGDAREVNAVFDPRAYSLWKQELSGRFGGIGARIGMRRGPAATDEAGGTAASAFAAVEILETIPGSAAEEAKLMKGDLVVAIDGKPVGDSPLAALVAQLRGEEGTPVTLELLRAGAAPFDVSLTRKAIRSAPVKLEMLAGGVARFCIGSMDPETMPGLTAALAQSAKAGATGLVLDLRGCPGGKLDIAVTAAGAFLPAGSPVVTLSRPGGNEETLTTAGPPLYTGPLVVLTGCGTASGGEILASALQAHGRALVAGEPTFGKRTAETVFDLEGGYGAKLTTARFRRPGAAPDGDPGFPVVPDVRLAAAAGAGAGASGEGPDAQLAAAAALVQWRREGPR